MKIRFRKISRYRSVRRWHQFLRGLGLRPAWYYVHDREPRPLDVTSEFDHILDHDGNVIRWGRYSPPEPRPVNPAPQRHVVWNLVSMIVCLAGAVGAFGMLFNRPRAPIHYEQPKAKQVDPRVVASDAAWVEYQETKRLEAMQPQPVKAPARQQPEAAAPLFKGGPVELPEGAIQL